jgi:hypothetical protein
MNRFLILLLLSATSLFSQINLDTSKEKDGYYLEDQIYIGFAYNILIGMPETISQSGFSSSIFIGFIKDIPINKERNFGFGIGLGLSADTYFQNMKIFKEANEIKFENFQQDESFSSNRFSTHSVDLPLEIRWRTSTPTDYSFWRIYAGATLKYVFASRAKFDLNGTQKTNLIDEVEKLQYGLTMAAGHGTWNLYFYYGLKNIFEDANFNGVDSINTKNIILGLKFYVL